MIMILNLLLALSLGAASDQTLRENARQGKPVNISVDCDCGPAPEFRDVVSKADVILSGTITQAVPRLTPDEKEIETVYTLIVNRIIAQRDQIIYDRPGPVAPFHFVQKGGSLSIDGIPVSMVLEWLPPIPVGTQGVFLLTRSVEPEVYVITSTPYGAFRLQGDQVTPMTRKKDVYQQYVGIGLAGLLRELEELRLETWGTSR